MSIHKPLEILLVTNDGLVQTSGGSTKLAKGVVGIANRALPNTVNGVPMVNSFPATGNYEIRYGVHDGPATRDNSNKSWRSLPFKLDEVIDIKVSAPKLGSAVDEVWIGYDGINDDSAIVLDNGESAAFTITLQGEGLALLGYPNGIFIHEFVITAPNEGVVNMQEIILDAVKELKEVKLNGDVPITDYVTITPIDSTRVTPTGTEFQMFTLTVPNDGTSNQQALVQQQYPNLDIKYLGNSGSGAMYTVAIPATDDGEGGTEFVPPANYNLVNTEITLDCEDYASSTNTNTAFTWEEGEVCTATPITYTLTIADDVCGDPRTTEVQAAYPDLTITAGTSENCQTTFTTTVLSDLVCEECSPIILDVFSSEAPHAFDMIDWVEAGTTFNAAALLGIRFKGKVTESFSQYPYDREIPFVDDFVRLTVSGGYPMTVAENFVSRTERFPARLIRRGYKAEARGYEFKELEKRSRVYFTGQPACTGLYEEMITGSESLIKNAAQYCMYSITIRRKRYSQSNSQTHEQNNKYDLLVEVGKHKSLEAFVNTLATAAGLPTVQAYGGN